MRQKMKKLLFVLFALLLAGCATTATHPALQAANNLPELIPVRGVGRTVPAASSPEAQAPPGLLLCLRQCACRSRV